MRQLISITPISLKPSEVGSTCRLGLKWANAQTPEEIELVECGGPDHPEIPQHIVGHGVVEEIWVGPYKDIPARLVDNNHIDAHRSYVALRDAMLAAYGKDFSEGAQVTVLTYTRTD